MVCIWQKLGWCGAWGRESEYDNLLLCNNLFQSSLTELMEKMKASRPRFIRCIKPNTEKMRDSFVSHYVQKQLRYTGVMETARIRQHGFPTRLTFHDFCKRFDNI